eukprot:scaffold62640_cov18-Tisochrysis_lutea.AAC.2
MNGATPCSYSLPPPGCCQCYHASCCTHLPPAQAPKDCLQCAGRSHCAKAGVQVGERSPLPKHHAAGSGFESAGGCPCRAEGGPRGVADVA